MTRVGQPCSTNPKRAPETPWKANAFNALWVLTVMTLMTAAVLWTLRWADFKKGDQTLREAMSEGMVSGYGLGERTLTPAELATFTKALTDEAQEEADEKAAKAAEDKEPVLGPDGEPIDVVAPPVDPVLPHRTVDLPMSGDTAYIVFCIYVPFALMGIAGIISTMLAPEAESAPKVFALKQRLRNWLSRPVVPAMFWRTWFNGLSLAECFVYFWIILPQLWYFGYRLRDAMENWDAGKVKTVDELKSFNVHHYYLRWLSIMLAKLFNLEGAFLMLPVARGSVFNHFLGIKYGQAIKFHRFVGTMALVSTLLHGITYQVLWLTEAGLWEKLMFQWKISHGVSNLAGTISWIGVVVLGATLLPFTRRAHYYIFYNAHVIGAVLFLVFGILHDSAVALYITFGVVVWGIDVVYRYVQTSHSVQIRVQFSEDRALVTLWIPLEDGVDMKADSHVWICVPALKRLDYHPFSVAGVSCGTGSLGRREAVVHVKVYDKWTKKLLQLAEQQGTMSARIQGPYDGVDICEDDSSRFSSMLFIGGGSGVTAAIPYLQRLAAAKRQSAQKGVATPAGPALQLLLMVRNEGELHLLSDLLPFHDVIDVTVHYTGAAPLVTSALAMVSGVSSGGAFVDEKSADSAEKGTQHSDSSRMAIERTAMPSELLTKPQFLGLWIVVSFAAIWVGLSYRAYSKWTDASQLLDTERNLSDHYAGVLMAVLVGFVLPMAIIVPAHLFNRFAARRAAGKGEAVEKSAASLSLPDAPRFGMLAQVRVDSTGAATLGLANDSSIGIPVKRGRPDIVALVAAHREAAGAGGLIAVFASGPKLLNDAVYAAVYKDKWGSGVEFRQLTTQL